ncbi:UvrD-helicase domain-containing protein, partial [Salmonella enterica subsp. diarizonae serovar 11:k:z53]
MPILYQECFTHIFLDEFQDTTLQQYELISLLFLN